MAVTGRKLTVQYVTAHDRRAVASLSPPSLHYMYTTGELHFVIKYVWWYYLTNVDSA